MIEETESSVFLFDQIWFPRVFKIAREKNLDWRRICAAALVLSKGDANARQLDWDFLYSKMGPDNPSYVGFYHNDEPTVELVDRASRWGLFQIYGEQAVQSGYQGRLINLTDVVKNTLLACHFYQEAICEVEAFTASRQDPAEIAYYQSNIVSIAEQKLGWDSDAITVMADDISQQVTTLLEISL